MVDHLKARLAHYPAFETDDADEAQKVLQNGHFRVEPVGGRYHLSSHTAILDSVAISSMIQSYPRYAWMEGDGRFFVLVLCNHGGNKFVYGGRTFSVGSGQGLLLTPDQKSYIEASGEQDLIAIRIPAESLLNDARNLLGGRPLAAIEPLAIIEKGSAVWQMAEYMVNQLEQPAGLFAVSPLAARDLQHAFRTALLQATPNTCQALLDVEPVRVAFWHVRRCRRAEDYMDAHLLYDVSLADLAKAAGVSGPALEKSFRIYRQKRPMEVLREKRIHRIHHELLHQPGSSVKALRLAYGQTNSGRFARDYYQLIGETPSETERKGKPHRG